MTGITDITGINMESGLATGRGAVVTTEAIAHEGTVIRCAAATGYPGRGDMANIAFLCRHNMAGTFTGRGIAIMATAAYTEGLTMVKTTGQNRYPARREFFMAGVADIGRTHM